LKKKTPSSAVKKMVPASAQTKKRTSAPEQVKKTKKVTPPKSPGAVKPVEVSPKKLKKPVTPKVTPLTKKNPKVSPPKVLVKELRQAPSKPVERTVVALLTPPGIHPIVKIPKKRVEKVAKEQPGAVRPTKASPKPKTKVPKESADDVMPEVLSPLMKKNPTVVKASIEEIPNEDAYPTLLQTKDDEEDSAAPAGEWRPKDYDTRDDVWDEDLHKKMALHVAEIAEYLLNDDEVLLEYSADFSTLQLTENLTFDSPLTNDGTSRAELKKIALGMPLRKLRHPTKKSPRC